MHDFDVQRPLSQVSESKIYLSSNQSAKRADLWERSGGAGQAARPTRLRYCYCANAWNSAIRTLSSCVLPAAQSVTFSGSSSWSPA
jgi:hypothetical protein